MSTQAVGNALEAMQDDEARERMAVGDFRGIEPGQLDEHEQYLVQRAAADYPEVLPFFTLVEMSKQVTFGSTPGLSVPGASQLPAVQLPAVQLPAVQVPGAKIQDGWSAAFNYAVGANG